MFGRFQSQAMLLSGFGGVRAGIALVDICHLDGAAGHLLDPLGQGRNLLAVALIGRRDGQRQEVASVSTAM